MELLTAPATVLLARVYQPVIVLHYRLYWINLDLTDPEHLVSANRPVILDLSVSRSYWLPKYPAAASCGFSSQRCAAHLAESCIAAAVIPDDLRHRLRSLRSRRMWRREHAE